MAPGTPARTAPSRWPFALEQPAVHLISFLEAYEWITLYPVNPITLQKYREAFITSRAKDDAQDADYLADLLLTHHAKLKPWAPEDSPTRAVQQRVLHRRAVVDERTALTNRLIALLKQYFPQALVLCGDDLWWPWLPGSSLNGPEPPGCVKGPAGHRRTVLSSRWLRSAQTPGTTPGAGGESRAGDG